MIEFGGVGVEVAGCSSSVTVVVVTSVNDGAGGSGGALTSVQ